MSIFLIALLVFLVAALVSLLFLASAAIANKFDPLDSGYFKAAYIIYAILCIVGIPLGVYLDDRSERVYVQEYLAKKQTIEYCLKNEELTPLDRIDIVNTVITLNGELAVKKERFERWDRLHYDYSIYDGVELIDLSGGVK